MAKKKEQREVRTNVAGPEEMTETRKALHARFGEASFQRASVNTQPDRISTGSFMLDFCLLGGIPHNRISMVVGEKHAGKSTQADLIVASAQRQYPDQIAAYIDVEGTHDTVWASKLGVDVERLEVFQSETGEAAVDAADSLVRTKEVSLLIVDSIAALTPMKEIDASAEDDAIVAMQSRLVGSMIRKVNSGLIAERNRGHYVTVLFVNQFRMKIGVQWGDPRSVPGGKALEFATSVQWIIKNKENMGKDEFDAELVSVNEHAFDIKKNKLNNGPRSGEFRLLRAADNRLGLTEGRIDDAETLLAYAKKFGAWNGAAANWKLDFWGVELDFQGEKGNPAVDQAVLALYEDPDLYWKLRNFLICEQAQHLGMPAEFYERFYPE